MNGARVGGVGGFGGSVCKSYAPPGEPPVDDVPLQKEGAQCESRCQVSVWRGQVSVEVTVSGLKCLSVSYGVSNLSATHGEECHGFVDL